jgi:purine-binding chemotaxis protein CheW
MPKSAMPSNSHAPPNTRQVVIYRVANQRFALPLESVETAVPAVEITPLPGAPEFIPGIINVHGRILPVIDTRRYFGFPAREMIPSDRLLIARIGSRTAALWVDDVEEVRACTESDYIPADDSLPPTHTMGAVELPSGEIILLEELGACLSHAEGQQLDQAMNTT